jgi:DNA-binding NarL/FixJ family response regulator
MQGVMRDLLSGVGPFDIVAAAATEAEAKYWLQEHPGGWDLAIIDLILEQGTGMGVIAPAHEQGQGGRIVVFSDYATPGIRRHCQALGADAVFQKSQEMAEFLQYCATLADPEPVVP